MLLILHVIYSASISTHSPLRLHLKPSLSLNGHYVALWSLMPLRLQVTTPCHLMRQVLALQLGLVPPVIWFLLVHWLRSLWLHCSPGLLCTPLSLISSPCLQCPSIMPVCILCPALSYRPLIIATAGTVRSTFHRRTFPPPLKLWPHSAE